MARDRISDISKKLSWLLRHAATAEGLSMDAAGFVPVEQVLRRLRVDLALLEQVARENTKSRLEFRGAEIRACQGHSREGLPVTLEALEASWQRYAGPDSVWHGTGVAAAASIAREGIHPGERTHVHLAEAVDSRVGKRAGVDVLLEVSVSRLEAGGIGVFRSPNGVVLARRVPPSCLVGLSAMTTRGEAEQAALRALLAAPAAGA